MMTRNKFKMTITEQKILLWKMQKEIKETREKEKDLTSDMIINYQGAGTSASHKKNEYSSAKVFIDNDSEQNEVV